MIAHLLVIGKIVFSLLGFVFLLCFFPKIRLFSIPLLTLAGIACFLFPFTLFGLGSVGVRAIQALNIAAYAVSIGMLVWKRKKGTGHPIKNLLIFFACFAFLIGICGVLSRYWELSKYDEYSNYRKVVQSLVLFGRKTAEVTHPEYPYGMGLIQYYFVSTGIFHEHILLFANAVTFFSAMFYLASYAKKPGLFAGLLCAVSVLLIYVLGSDRFPEIMLDSLIGGIFAAVLFSAIHLPERLDFGECAERVVLFAFFILIKDVCAAFLMVAFVLIFYKQIHACGGFPKWNVWKKMLLCGALSCLPYLAWFTHLKVNQIGNSHPLGNITLSKIWYMLRHLNEDTSLTHSFHMYVRKVFMEPFGTTGINIFGICLIFGTIGMILYFVTGQKQEAGITLILFLCAAAYRVYVGLSYIFVLESDYPLTFSEFERFILSYLLGWGILVFCGLLYGFEWKKTFPAVKICFTIVLCFILTKTPWMDLFTYHEPEKKWVRMKQFVNEYGELFSSEDSIFTLFDNDRERAMLVSLLFGKSNIATEYLFSVDETNWSADELHAFIEASGANYVLTDRPDKEFWAKYGNLFGGEPENTAIYQLYRIEPNGDYSPID